MLCTPASSPGPGSTLCWDSWQGLWLPCFPLQAVGAADVCRGGNLAFTSGLPDEGILVFQLALAQGKIYFSSFCGLDS